MKKHRKKIITIFAVCMFAIMMMLNVSTTINGSNFSVEGYSAVVSGNTGGWIYYGTWQTCWSDPFGGYNQIYICRSGPGNCCVPCQHPC